MKITVTATKSQPPVKTPYPMMMENVKGTRMIVCFHSSNRGVLVFIDDEDPDHRILKEYADWIVCDNKDYWKPFTGDIVIKSQ